MYFDYRFEPSDDYLCIDCKSFYASVECVNRGLILNVLRYNCLFIEVRYSRDYVIQNVPKLC